MWESEERLKSWAGLCYQCVGVGRPDVEEIRTEERESGHRSQ